MRFEGGTLLIALFKDPGSFFLPMLLAVSLVQAKYGWGRLL
jgi:hypothetical protein